MAWLYARHLGAAPMKKRKTASAHPGLAQLSLWIEQGLMKKIKLRAVSQGRPLKILVAEALEAFLRRHK